MKKKQCLPSIKSTNRNATSIRSLAIFPRFFAFCNRFNSLDFVLLFFALSIMSITIRPFSICLSHTLFLCLFLLFLTWSTHEKSFYANYQVFDSVGIGNWFLFLSHKSTITKSKPNTITTATTTNNKRFEGKKIIQSGNQSTIHWFQPLLFTLVFMSWMQFTIAIEIVADATDAVANESCMLIKENVLYSTMKIKFKSL